MKQRIEYNYGINFMRAVAIIGIVLYHIFPLTIQGGFLGVCFFFLISGYLLARQTSLSWENQEFSFRKYYIKKFLRIYPPLYIMVMTVLSYFTLFQRPLLLGAREETASIFLGVNNWWQMATHASYFMQVTEHSPFTHLWYMGVEMEYLLLWPVLFWLYKKINEKTKQKGGILFLLLLIVASGILMGVLFHTSGVNRVYYGTDTRAFTFLMGVCLGLCEESLQNCLPEWFFEKGSRVVFSVCLGITLALFVLVQGESSWLYQGGMLGISLLFALLVFSMNCIREQELLFTRSRILQFIGKKSYYIYLWHYPILFVVLYLF